MHGGARRALSIQISHFPYSHYRGLSVAFESDFVLFTSRVSPFFQFLVNISDEPFHVIPFAQSFARGVQQVLEEQAAGMVARHAEERHG